MTYQTNGTFAVTVTARDTTNLTATTVQEIVVVVSVPGSVGSSSPVATSSIQPETTSAQPTSTAAPTDSGDDARVTAGSGSGSGQATSNRWV